MLRRMALLVALLGALPALAAAATLRIGLVADPDTLDPEASGSFVALEITHAICDKLIDIDPDLNTVPLLATGWQWSDDRKALTLTLRQGLVFHDGEAFDAATVKWNLNRYQTSPASKRVKQLEPIKGVSVLDPATVRVELAAPYAPLLMLLADRPGMMLAPRATAAAGNKATENPVCLGPYAFVRRVAQDRIFLRRAANYWDPGRVGFDELQFVTVPDANLRLIGLRTGQLDLIERVAPTDLDTVRGDQRLRLVSKPGLGYQLLQFNLDNGPAADNPLGKSPLVREAFEASIDRKALNDVVFAGAYMPDNQPEPVGGTYYDPDFPVPARDVARAKALLKEAGVEHPSFTLRIANDPVGVQIGEVLQSMSAEAGFDMKVQPMEAVSLFDAADRGDFQAIFAIWSGRPDPDQNISIWVASDGFLNRGMYRNAELDGLLARASAILDTAERVKLYREAAAIYLRERPYLFLYHYNWLWAASTKLGGFVPYPDGVIRVRGMRPE